MTATATSQRGLSVPELVGLTAGKTVVNVAIRWIPFFLPVLGRAFGATLPQMTSVVGVGETAGFLTAATGRWLDRGRERLVMLVGMAMVMAATLLAIVGSFGLFVAAHFLLMLGVSLYTVAGHAYISRHVPFDRRGRSIGIFEVSWALGLFIGAPTAALLIEGVSWRAPFIAIGLLASGAAAALMIWRRRNPPVDVTLTHDELTNRVRLTRNAWYAVGASTGIALAGLATIVVVGTWMEEVLGVSLGGVGGIAMIFGLVELGSSSGSAAFSDRLGKNRSTRVALVLLIAGLGIMTAAGPSLLLGVVGLGLFFMGFEYAIVTSFSVVSEAMPSARGRVLAVNTALSTVGRGVGSIGSGLLYDRYGIGGTAALAALGAACALTFLSQVHE